MRNIDPWELLANAIIMQAVNDYRRLWNFQQTEYPKRDILDFFHSEWFTFLTKLDPEWLIEVLEKEADEKREKINRST